MRVSRYTNITTRPTFIINDMVTWTRSAHTLKFGTEYRKVMGNLHQTGNQAGTFTFARGATGLLGVNSGSPVASFLLGAVDNGNVDLSDHRRLVSQTGRVDSSTVATPGA